MMMAMLRPLQGSQLIEIDTQVPRVASGRCVGSLRGAVLIRYQSGIKYLSGTNQDYSISYELKHGLQRSPWLKYIC